MLSLPIVFHDFVFNLHLCLDYSYPRQVDKVAARPAFDVALDVDDDRCWKPMKTCWTSLGLKGVFHFCHWGSGFGFSFSLHANASSV